MSDVKIQRSRTALRPFAMVYGPAIRDTKVSDGAFRTLLLLDLLCGSDGEGHHSIGLIAQLRDTDVRTIRRHLGELKDAKVLDVEYRDGATNLITILDPIETYGGEAISGFYDDVRRISAERRGTPDKNVTPDNPVLPTPDKNVLPPRTILSSRTDNKEPDEVGVEPFGGTAPAGASPETPKTPPTDQPTDPPDLGAIPASGPLRSARGGSGMIMPGSEPSPDEVRRTKKAKTKPREDGTSDPNSWTAYSAAGYFRTRFMKKWPGEGAPEVLKKDLPTIQSRIAWLRSEGIEVGMMKRAIDYVFDHWDNGLRGRIGWEGSRPSLALIEATRLFEKLVREVQNGVSPKKVLPDEYDAERAKKMPEVGWGPV